MYREHVGNQLLFLWREMNKFLRRGIWTSAIVMVFICVLSADGHVQRTYLSSGTILVLTITRIAVFAWGHLVFVVLATARYCKHVCGSLGTLAKQRGRLGSSR